MGLEFRVEGSEFKDQGSRLRVEDLGFRARSLQSLVDSLDRRSPLEPLCGTFLFYFIFILV